jgi:hypothetical protein
MCRPDHANVVLIAICRRFAQLRCTNLRRVAIKNSFVMIRAVRAAPPVVLNTDHIDHDAVQSSDHVGMMPRAHDTCEQA